MTLLLIGNGIVLAIKEYGNNDGGSELMLSSGSILVVDDEINLCRILGAKLAKSGFSVVAVHDGEQAIEKVKERNFDVVILDLMLPKVDGLTALEEVRSLHGDLPVIVMTACGSQDYMERAKRQGVSAYINKPFDLDSLVDLVKTTSAQSSNRQCNCSERRTVLFAEGQSIILEVRNGKTGGVFQSKIIERDERTLSVTTPSRKGKLVEISVRTPVRVGLAANEAYYSFNSYVVDLQKSPAPVVVLNKPGVIYRTQRRKSPRVPVEADVRFGRVSDPNDRPDSFATGRTCDISAGGMRIITANMLDPGDLVYLEADDAGRFGSISSVAEVLRARKSDSEGNYIIAMQFDASKRVQDIPSD